MMEHFLVFSALFPTRSWHYFYPLTGLETLIILLAIKVIAQAESKFGCCFFAYCKRVCGT